MTRSIHDRRRVYSCTAILCAGIVLAAGVSTACHQGAEQKKYTWADRLPGADCNPRTANAKAQLGGCPKLADPQHPTSEEEQEFVAYMNKKDVIEGTNMDGAILPPGCYQWGINAGQVNLRKVSNEQRCQGSDLEKKLQNYPSP